MQSLAKRYEKASLSWKWEAAGHTQGKAKSWRNQRPSNKI